MEIGAIHPIQNAKTTWSEASNKKKAAIVASGVAGAAAVASVVYAAKTGKAPNDATGLSKVFGRLQNGYKDLGSKIADAFKNLAEKFGKNAEAPVGTEKVAEEVGETVA